jgi:type VI secretion system protein ImpK
MAEDLVAEVYPLLRQALRYRDELMQSKPLSIERVQSDLRGKMRVSDRGEARRDGGYGEGQADDYLGTRYALVCWLDELFIIDSPWNAQWTESKFEAQMYRTNDRAWKFWEQATMASARSDRVALQVFHLCMLLGFRGNLHERTRELAEKREQIENQAGLKGKVTWTEEPAETPVPPPEVDILTAPQRLRWLMFGLVVVVYGAITVAGFLALTLVR